VNRRAFTELCGESVYHITAATNSQSIAQTGLLSAAALAQRESVDPQTIALRAGRLTLSSGAVLNHQKPLLMGRGKDTDFLDGHTLESWAAQLDRRIYFAPHKKLAALKGSFEIATEIYEIDTAALFDALGAHLWLSPINSGSADRRPVPRGDWLYTPATAPAEKLRTNRRDRGLVKTRDTVREVSLTCSIPPDVLSTLLR